MITKLQQKNLEKIINKGSSAANNGAAEDSETVQKPLRIPKSMLVQIENNLVGEFGIKQTRNAFILQAIAAALRQKT